MCLTLNLSTSTVITSPLYLLHTPLSTSSGSIRFWLSLLVLLAPLNISFLLLLFLLFHLYLAFPLPFFLLFVISFNRFLVVSRH